MPRLTGEESYAKQAKTMAEHLLEKIGDKGQYASDAGRPGLEHEIQPAVG